MFIEPTITWVSSGFSGYIWLDTKIVLKKNQRAAWTKVPGNTEGGHLSGGIFQIKISSFRGSLTIAFFSMGRCVLFYLF